MKADNYLHTHLSPYRLNEDALKLIEELCECFSHSVEDKIIILINAATMHPSMSKYQLSLTHKALGDCYYGHGYFGSALEQYERGLSLNPKLPVKRKIKEIMSMQTDEKRISQSPDLVFDVLAYPEYSQVLKNDVYQSPYERVREELVREARESDSIYDPDFEADIESRLNLLGEPYKSEFYRVMELYQKTRPLDDVLSLQKHALLTLKSMEESVAFYQRKGIK